MGQREKIISLLQNGNAMTPKELAERIYHGDYQMQYVYMLLHSLERDGVVTRTDSRPAFYSLSGVPMPVSPTRKAKKAKRDISGDVISDETLDKAAEDVKNTDNYGPEFELSARCLKQFPENTDPVIVALKAGLIDITNSTNLSRYKSKINIDELSRIIAAIPNLDERIAAGDPEVVNEIARSNGRINLFSFASKYCCYHNTNVYGRDDYSIFDTILKESLPRYFSDITQSQIQRWRTAFRYAEYNDYITRKLDELGITTPNRKRKFDHFVWYKNRKKE